MKKALLLAGMTALVATGASAENWTLDGDTSRLAFGSVKSEYVGEIHSFSSLTGSVTDGRAEIAIDLSSIDTLIDIRNERMIEHVFKNAPKAMISAELDMAALEAMAPGETGIMEVDATLSFLGRDLEVFTEMFVARMSDDTVLVTTNDFAFLGTDELGIDAGVDMLKELAGLDSITRAVPVAMRLVFNAEGSSS